MADAADLKSAAERREGSTPSAPTRLSNCECIYRRAYLHSLNQGLRSAAASFLALLLPIAFISHTCVVIFREELYAYRYQ